MRRVLGVDGGGTGSRAALVDEKGNVLSFLSGQATNPNSVGTERAREQLKSLIDCCLHEAGLTQVDAAVFGLAGINNAKEEREVEVWLHSLGFCSNIVVENDSVAAWAAATLGQPGIVIIAGTGSIAFGVDHSGRRRRAGGWGYVFGDEGSGFRIASEALRAAVRYRDGRGPWTRLLPALLRKLGLDSTDGLTRAVYAHGMETSSVARLFPTVVEVARAGDPVAVSILRRSGQQLAEQAIAVMEGLDLDPNGAPFVVGLSGGVFQSGELVTRSLREVLTSYAPAARVQALHVAPVLGAALLALRQIGVQVDEDLARAMSLHGVVDDNKLPQATVPTPETTDINLDQLSTNQLLEYLSEHDRRVAHAVRLQLPAVARAVDAIAHALANNGRVFYVGAGTSGRLGLLDAVECPPTFGYAPDRFTAIVAGGCEALYRAIEGAEDDAQAGAQAIADQEVAPNDVVVGIAASGNTPFTVAAVDAAARAGATTVGVTATPGSRLAERVDVSIVAATGPEAIIGSTRLKAGTAQKMVLNMLSTAASVRLGKVHGRSMVDVQPTNTKLRRRAIDIVQGITACDRHRAEVALEACDYEVKPAIVSVARQVSPRRARQLLLRHNGFLRPILEGGGDHAE